MIASVSLLVLGLVQFTLALFDRAVGEGYTALLLWLVPFTVGGLGVGVLPYLGTTPGIKNDGIFHSAAKARGWSGWLLGVLITAFYCAVYWFPQYLSGLINLVSPLYTTLTGKAAEVATFESVRNAGWDPRQWFLYGLLYTLAVAIMGARMGMRYRHNRYQLIRTGSVVFFQLAFGFMIPQFLQAMQQPEFYFTYFWPLKKEYFFPSDLKALFASGHLGLFMAFWGVAMAFVATPVLTYFYGKRWYCSWVCGCGGLAETAGDPFRQLSDKSLNAWKFERWAIHIVLVLITVTTGLVWANSASEGQMLGEASQSATRWYGFLVGSVLSGVVGVGFYPIMGTRVWCRNFCPQAAILGLLQRFFSRFRITTNGGQCISCGNCSTYCEMGIDVRAYAQRGENIIRASCVGCGVCAAVCPRGVLKLENGATSGDRFPNSDKPLQAFLDAIRK
jgi:Pyruvate/2-oxoacid:ferredoxin oxidoreductase delta subunit